MAPNFKGLSLGELNFDDIMEHQGQEELIGDPATPKNDLMRVETGDEEEGVNENSDRQQPPPLNDTTLSWLLLFLQATLLVLFFVGSTLTIEDDDYSQAENVIFRDILVMLLLGFGFLMTFLRKNGLGAVGLTMLLTALAVQLNIFTELLMRFLQAPSEVRFPLPITIPTLIDGDFAAATLLISYGAVIERASPVQLTIMTVLQSFFYALNKVLIVAGWWEAEDVGGTLTIHLFGTYFGLAVSRVMGPPPCTANAPPSAISDVLSLLGTALLWVHWPSFVGATETANPLTENRCIIHTVLALLGSTVASFFLSQRLCNKLDPVHIANSTLAGGVAIGTSARLNMTPGGALLLGVLASLTSVFGYVVYGSSFLERKVFGIHDTCGVHNLHGLPSVLGGLASIVFVAIDSNADFLSDRKSVSQLCLSQFMAVLFTIVVATVSGLLTGYAMVLGKTTMRRRQSTDASEDGCI
jgi:ammonium transporter Rh